MTKILVTGGAGFIGSHLVDALLNRGFEVIVLDSLVSQVHGGEHCRPAHLDSRAKLIVGDVRDPDVVRAVLKDCDVVFHLAAAVGVGQSMYAIREYVSTNCGGTATLLESMMNSRKRPLRLVVASSMSVYGEGAYRCEQCGSSAPAKRPVQQLEAREWNLICPTCGATLQPVPTPEAKPLHPGSVYAINKRDQEEMCLCVGRAHGIPTVALRFFNTYGPRQALSNPYTGVAAIFCSRLLNNKPPLIYEDGLQQRDFVSVHDVVKALLLAMDSPQADYGVFNVGTGMPVSILDLATMLGNLLGRDLQPQIVGRFREGDIRHCYADITKIQRRLGFKPKVKLDDGLVELIEWVQVQEAMDITAKALTELERRSLLK